MSGHSDNGAGISEEGAPRVAPESQCCGGLGTAASAALVVGMYVLDQATKLWTAGLDLHREGWPVIPQRLELGDGFPVVQGWFHWVHFSNTGAAFGIMHDSNRFFIGLSIAALLGLGWSLKRRIFPGILNTIALLLLLSGVLGNFTDRLVHGYVVDFLLFDLGFPPFNPWPAFNVADSCICTAVGLLLLVTFQEARAAKKVQHSS